MEKRYDKGIIMGVIAIIIAFSFIFSNIKGLSGVTGAAVYNAPVYTQEEAIKKCDRLCVPAMNINETRDRLKSEYCVNYFYIKESGKVKSINGKNIKYYCDYHWGKNLTSEEPYDNIGDDCYLGKYKDNPETPNGNEAAIGVECGVPAPY